jgi:hypothetical protein
VADLTHCASPWNSNGRCRRHVWAIVTRFSGTVTGPFRLNFPLLIAIEGAMTKVFDILSPGTRSPAARADLAFRALLKLAVALCALGGLAHVTPAAAQVAALYEQQDQSDQQGRRFGGSASWRTEEVAGTRERAVRADIEIPERKMTVILLIRRNTDRAMPATHIIEITFRLPPHFPGGGIENVPGILMKGSEQARAIALSALAVKVTTDVFLIGLSGIEVAATLNTRLLHDQGWFDIPIVYATGNRAILVVEKGATGERAFADAFAAWEKRRR